MKREKGEVTLVAGIGLLIYGLIMGSILVHAEKKAEQCEQKVEQALVVEQVAGD